MTYCSYLIQISLSQVIVTMVTKTIVTNHWFEVVFKHDSCLV